MINRIGVHPCVPRSVHLRVHAVAMVGVVARAGRGAADVVRGDKLSRRNRNRRHELRSYNYYIGPIRKANNVA